MRNKQQRTSHRMSAVLYSKCGILVFGIGALGPPGNGMRFLWYAKQKDTLPVEILLTPILPFGILKQKCREETQ